MEIKKFYELIKDSPHVSVKIASSKPKKFKIASYGIKKLQNTDYSHVLIIINDMVFQASHGLCNSFHLDEFLKENIIIDIIEVQKEECDLEYLFETLGKRYGYFQLFKIGIKYLLITKLRIFNSITFKDNGNKYLICCEYVGRFLKIPWVNDETDVRMIIDHLYKIKK